MPLVSTIIWRDASKEKPPHTLDGEYLLVQFRGSQLPFEAWYNEGPETFHDPKDDAELSNITHFALPGDITTREGA